MQYEIKLIGVKIESQLADALDELDGNGDGSIVFEDSNELIAFLNEYASQAGLSFKSLTLTQWEV